MFDTKKNLVWSQLKVGWIISLALVIIFFAVFFSGSLRRLISPERDISVRIRDVSGLKIGAAVWLLGVEIGKVKSIQLGQQGSLVILAVRQNDLKFIRRNASATVLAMGLLGEKYVEISPGTPEAGPLESNQEIQGTTEVGFRDIMDRSTESIEKVDTLITELNQLVKKIGKGKGTLAELIKNPVLYDNLNRTVETISSEVKELKKSQGTMALLIKDPALYNKMLSASTSIETFGENLNKSSGSLNKFINDPSLYNHFNKSLSQLSTILDRIDKGEGLAGAMVNNQALLKELQATLGSMQETLRSIRELSQDIKKNPHRYFSIHIF